jgi:hypothetical protein
VAGLEERREATRGKFRGAGEEDFQAVLRSCFWSFALMRCCFRRDR